MSTHAHPRVQDTILPWPVELAVGTGVAVVALALDNLVLNGPGERGSLPSFVILTVLCAVTAWALATRVVQRPADEGARVNRGLVTGLVGLGSLILFWTGLPLVLGAAAIAAGRRAAARRGDEDPGVAADSRAVIAVGAAAALVGLAAFAIDLAL